MLPPVRSAGPPAINAQLQNIAKTNAPSTAAPPAVSPTVVPKVGGQNFLDYLTKSNESSQTRREKGFQALQTALSLQDPTVPNKAALPVGGGSGSNVALTAKDTSITSPAQFANSLLKGLGITPNAQNTKALQAWARAEGGHWHNTASYNPLNTTQAAAGASTMSGGNTAGVKAYKDWAQGLQATLQTLNNGRYGNIIQALRSGSAYDIAHAVANSPWGTGSGVIRALGG